MTPPTEFLSELRKNLVARFSLSELETLCFDLGVSYDELAGQTTSEKARALIAYLVRRDGLIELIEICRRERPNSKWTERELVGVSERQITSAEAGISQRQYLQVFLCHANSDKTEVKELYDRLLHDGFDPWLDSEKILAGHDWNTEIVKALRTSDVVIVCSSKASVSKTGYLQREIKFALDRAQEHPEGSIYIIPLKLQECDLPDSLNRYQWVKLFEPTGYERLLAALKTRAASLSIRPSSTYKY